MDFKQPGDAIYLIGEFQPTFGGSHWSLVIGSTTDMPVPDSSALAPQVYRRLHQAVTRNLLRAGHDLSEGGLAVTIAEMAIGGRLGAQLNLPAGESQQIFFGETNGCLVVEVTSENCAEFEELMSPLPCLRIGQVASNDQLIISQVGQAPVVIPVIKLVSAWCGYPSK